MKVIIMRGPSGCGKSTYVEREFPEALVCSADHFFLDASGQYDFDPTKLGEAHAACFTKYLYCLRRRTPLVVVDNTGIHTWEIDHYAVAALALGYEVEVHQFSLKQVSQIRICARRSKVSPNVVYAQGCEFEHWPQARTVEFDKVKVFDLTLQSGG